MNIFNKKFAGDMIGGIIIFAALYAVLMIT